MSLRAGKNEQGRARALNGYQGSTRNAESLKLAFSSVPLEGTAPLELALSGYVLSLASLTDKPGELLVAFDQPRNFQRVSPGWQSTPFSDPFTTLWLMRSTNTPASSALFYVLTASWDRNYREGPIAPGVLDSGAGTFGVLVSPYNAAGFVLLVGANARRRLLVVQNVDDTGVPHFIAPSAGALVPALRINSEDVPLSLPYTGALVCDASANLQVAEVY